MTPGAEVKHTPGPLRKVLAINRRTAPMPNNLPGVVDESGTLVAVFYREADADFYAAAPDLLAALKGLCEAANESHAPGERGTAGRGALLVAISSANAAIARADGRDAK